MPVRTDDPELTPRLSAAARTWNDPQALVSGETAPVDVMTGSPAGRVTAMDSPAAFTGTSCPRCCWGC